MSGAINKVGDFEYFTTTYGSKILDLSITLKNVEDNMAVPIFKRNTIFNSYSIEEFIYDNIIVDNMCNKEEVDIN
jgi:hypothetical protein